MKLFILGLLSGLAFAPTFLFPALIGLGVLCYKTSLTTSSKSAAITGFIFGFGHFLSGLYWISIGPSVYIEQFWWAIPCALFGLPLFFALFISSICSISWYFRKNALYPLIFSLVWVIFEGFRSWIFTGFPWNLIGYSICFSEVLIQSASIIGIYGIGFCVVYIFSGIYYFFSKQVVYLYSHLIASSLIIITSIIFGVTNLQNNPTIFSDIKIRLVQPSIPQTDKWDIDEFWRNFNLQLKLSNQPNKVDLIFWSEAAMIVPHYYPAIKKELIHLLESTDSLLITGGVTDNGKENDNLEIYSSLYAMDKSGTLLFDYHKSHLVPFGEYIPFKNILPIKKLTHGLLDYTEGKHDLVKLERLNITIKPLICYESIFPEEVRLSNRSADLLVNATNDAWYGRSSGPYQHLYISLMRAVENGLPMVRVANNGISAIIDPQGRIIQKLPLNYLGFIDALLPIKPSKPTLYSYTAYSTVVILIIVISLLQLVLNALLKNYLFIHKNS